MEGRNPHRWRWEGVLCLEWQEQNSSRNAPIGVLTIGREMEPGAHGEVVSPQCFLLLNFRGLIFPPS